MIFAERLLVASYTGKANSSAKGIEVNMLEKLGDIPSDLSYRVYRIPKSSGGTRLIQEPNPELKAFQKKILQYLKRIPLSSYIFGLGGPTQDAVHHASVHLNKKCIVKMDIKHFFPSTTSIMVSNGWIHLRQPIEDLWSVAWYVFTESLHPFSLPCLPTGAPTSPYLSGIAFYPVDLELYFLADQMHMTYTRYIDDLIFSGDEYPPGLQRRVGEIVTHWGYTINHKKSALMYKDNSPQIVTGVSINQDPGVPRTDRRSLRAAMFRAAREGIPLDAHLRGQLAHVQHVNPHQHESLMRNYDRLVEKFSNGEANG